MLKNKPHFGQIRPLHHSQSLNFSAHPCSIIQIQIQIESVSRMHCEKLLSILPALGNDCIHRMMCLRCRVTRNSKHGDRYSGNRSICGHVTGSRRVLPRGHGATSLGSKL